MSSGLPDVGNLTLDREERAFLRFCCIAKPVAPCFIPTAGVVWSAGAIQLITARRS
jgi:hypothetical protein